MGERGLMKRECWVNTGEQRQPWAGMQSHVTINWKERLPLHQHAHSGVQIVLRSKEEEFSS
jgi:hypothetical protein